MLPGPQRQFTGRQLAGIAFPLGGIGTGTVCLGGRGELRDWEMFNRPDKGCYLPFAFFTIRACPWGGTPVLRVAQAPPLPPFNGSTHAMNTGTGFGVPRDTGAGLPHFQHAVFTGEYPFARIDLSDTAFPLQVGMEAWNPTIPHNAEDSGIPIAIFYWRLINDGDIPVDVLLSGNLPAMTPNGPGAIALREENDLAGLVVAVNAASPLQPAHGTLALSTSWEEVTYETCWLRPDFNAGWFAAFTDWAARLMELGKFRDDAAPAAQPDDVGSLGALATVQPHSAVCIPFFLSWSFPNFEKYWGGNGGDCCEGACARPHWQNYYARKFPDAWAAVRYTRDHLERLEAETRSFHDELFDSTLPPVVLDAVSSQLSILKSTTCLRLPDGTFYGFEGCTGNGGCCEGSCTHVWNYAQTHAFLYPALARSMREAEYRHSMLPDGRVNFRLSLPLGAPPNDFLPCADGQLGAVMQVYRDWQLGAGDDWLRAIWPSAKRALAYAWIAWDVNRDGLMEGVQHNTYDSELHGPNPMCGIPYLGALRAAACMAEHLGEEDFACECRQIADRGAQALDRLCFNGEYYFQPLEQESGLPNQVGDGCLIDQVFGQQLAHLYGLGDLLPEDHMRKAVQSIYRYNHQSDFREKVNGQRVFALNDEAGTVICTWPRGNRPPFALPYGDEVMIGFEYQLAAHLIYEGFVEEGLRVTRAVRDRHDGERRNPWNEFECGNHYARSMANWAIKLALDGFTFSATERRLGFAPKLNRRNYRTFWSTATGWGRYEQCLDDGIFRLLVVHGSQELAQLDLADLPDGQLHVVLPYDAPGVLREGARLHFVRPISLSAGECLAIQAAVDKSNE